MKYVGLLLLFCLVIGPVWAQNDPDTNLIFPINPTYDPTQTSEQSFDLGDPSSVERTIVYDPVTGKYIFKEVLGKSEMNYRNPSMMTLEEYIEYERKKALADNWKEKIDEQTAESQPFEFPIKVGSKVFENFFGSDQITIRTTGSVEISLGVNSSRYDNPILPVRQRRITRFDFQQQINLNLVGQIGTRVKLGTSYNTQAAFDFDNISTLEYTGDDDQIIQKIQLGNVAFQPPTSLIQGSQVLFGAYGQFKFGNTTVDVIGASSKGQRKEINITGKSQAQQFELSADNYESNRHYFLNMYHHDNYDKGMSSLPIPNTTINLSRIEVWVMNRTNETENTRNIIAFSDLGEAKEVNCQGDPGGYAIEDLPSNDANNLYNWAINQPLVRSFNNSIQGLASQITAPGPFQQAVHFEKVENARKLSDSEFSYNVMLGFISLNMPLNNDEVLAVSYEYTYQGNTYQVGEFSTDGIAGQDALMVKLLKPTITNPKNVIWDLMMKNVYSIGAYQVDQQGFRLDILYNNPETSVKVPFFPMSGVDDKQIVTLLEMDKLNQNNQPFSDGVFDFVPIVFNGNRAESAGTINRRNGRIYFTTVEPFGQTLADKLDAVLPPNEIPQVLIDQVAYTELYDSTKTAAQQIPAKNRFSFKGEYQSSISSDIPLNALNVPEGAVSVTAGGILLTEGVDYTVDYNLGRVKILNESYLNSNTPIKISIESNSVFGFQSKSLLGSRVSHRFSDKFNVGATWMRMMERPVTQKVDIGSEPYKNNIIGFDIAYRTDVPLLTKLVDLLPVISTKERSTFSFTGEFAHLIPGSPKAINKNGTSYIDDFEGAQSSIDLRSATAWHLASVPKGQTDLFPEATNIDLSAGYKRARTSWYVVDPLFAQGSNLTPQHIKDNPELVSDSRVRLVSQTQIWPNQQLALGTIGNIPILDLAYYPKERGMYNFDTTNTVDADGLFTDPANRWGGIMRALTTNDFELTNIEYIQFWMLDPFNEDAENADPTTSHTGGDMYFNLGNISEDVLPDSRRSFENGLPPFATSSQDNVDETSWARISTLQQTVNAFDNDPLSRTNQDVGYDGWGNADELLFYAGYTNWVQNNGTLSAATKTRMLADPSSDDYKYYRDDGYDLAEASILERYKRFRGLEGNSPTIEMSNTMNAEGYPTQGTNQPDMEEFNNNNTLDETESYFQYKVSLRPNDMQEGQNFITNVQLVTNGTKTERWLQFKVPIRDFEKRVNGIQDFRTIRFMRIFLKDFNEEVVVRFARLEFIRGEWRQYRDDLVEPGEGVTIDPNLTTFNIGAVNVEENDQREPIKYEIPPGITREVDPSQTFQRQLNEQSLTLEVCNLQDGDARAGYKNVQFDVRTYKKLKMFAHAERVEGQSVLNDDDLTLFVRLGTDFTDNYYEYEMPLKLTDFGAQLPEDIWPEGNNIEITFEDFLKMKKDRNELIASGSPMASYVVEYSIIDPADPTRVLKVKGNPNLQAMKVIMIGVRNPHINKNTPWADDGLSKCVNVWINELRLTDFVSEGGSAATAQMQVQFADFANLNMSGTYSGINWGSVDSRVQERQRNQKLNFDMNANVQLGQFFGKKARVQLPFFYSYSVGVINPEYDPFNPDIRLNDYDDPNVRKEKAKLGQDYTERKAYNFTNVRKELKAGADNHFWRVSNWSASYAYSQNLRRDFNTNYDRTRTWTSSLNYNYSFKSKPIMPFKKVKFMQKSKWWAIVRDMNFYLTPKNISFGTDAMRNYNERQIRNNIIPVDTPADKLSLYEIDPVYLKQFDWNRKYAMAYDITKKLKFTFNANNRSMFEEGDSAVVRSSFRDTLSSQLGTFGKAMDYSHNYTFKYTLPLSQFPATNWMSANATWKGSYNWQRGPLAQPDYGNTIQNSRDINMTAQLNFTSLYNKVKFFQKVNNGGRNPRGRASARDRNGATKGGSKKPEAEVDPEDENLTEKQKERKKRKKERKKDREDREKERGGKVHPVAGFFARALMTVRNVNGTYTVTDGTLLPGYTERAGILGFDPGNSAGIGGFVFGQQRFNVFGQETGYNIAERLSSDASGTKSYIVRNQNLNQQYTNTHSENINLRATLEPIKDLSIELKANRMYSKNSREFYRYNETTLAFESQSRVEISTLTYSNVSVSSAFALIGKEYESSVFDNLLANRKEVSELLGGANGNSGMLSSGYHDGYSATQQEVVLGAFLTSYTNRGVSDKNINPVRNLPLPNWSVNYNGLKNFKFMKKVLKNFVMRHGYTSSVSVSGIQTNLNASFDASGGATARDLNNNFLAQDQIQNVVVSERFSPLIGIDATWNIKGQGLITKFEYKKDRSASLSLNNNQVTEILGSEWVIGTGYKFSKVKLPFGKVPSSPVNLRVDISFRDNLTVIRNIDENSNQATAGQKVIAIKSSADYNLSKYLVIQFYYDHTLNTPKIATSYPTGNMSTGLRLRFNLAGVQ